MNLLLFEPHECENDRITLCGRRQQHLREQIGVTPGTTVRVGEVDGLMGSGTVLSVTPTTVELAVSLHQPPPPPLPLIMVLALPRPKMLRRILQTAATLGVGELHLVNSYRVEKSYWQTPWLGAAAIRAQLLLGLEQGVDTRLPRVALHKRFKPFVEDTLPTLVQGTRPLVAHPYTETECPVACSEAVTLAIGPEGGFIPYEVNKLVECGFQAVSLGRRILRVETAIPVLVGRLFTQGLIPP